jgi:hypothetical protein
MMVFFKIWPENSKKTIITLQALRFKLNCLNQTYISLKSIMQLTKTIFPDSAIFIAKKRVENRFWRKLWRLGRESPLATGLGGAALPWRQGHLRTSGLTIL